MNQQKTGRFLKEIRQEKGITQEQAAEKNGYDYRCFVFCCHVPEYDCFYSTIKVVFQELKNLDLYF